MKKIIVIIIILGAAGLAYFYSKRADVPVKAVDTPISTNENKNEATFRPDPSSATFTIDDQVVTLSGGRNEQATTPGSATTEETQLMNKFAYGDINADGKEDTALLLARFGGGSGTFIYAAAFVSGPVSFRGTDAVFVGDRVAVESISVSGGIVTVKYLDRGPDDAFSTEPTIPKTKQFIYGTGGFQEK